MQAVRGSMTGGLKANSLSFFESLVMRVAGSAPGYTIAVTTAVLLVHQRGDEGALSTQTTDALLMVAGQLAKLLKCLFVFHTGPQALGEPFERLTEREWVVLRGLNSDDGEKQLADRLSLSPHTLHSHIKSIYRKVGVQGRLPLLLRLQNALRDLRSATVNMQPPRPTGMLDLALAGHELPAAIAVG